MHAVLTDFETSHRRTLTDCPDAAGGEDVEIELGGDLDSSLPRQLSVAELQSALRLARSRRLRQGVSGHAAGARIECHLAVFGAHSAAGASTVALAVADAAAATGRPTQLIEHAAPTASGLTAVTTTEHGTDTTASWRRGRRGPVIVYRRAGDDPPTAPPTQPDVGGGELIIADLSGTRELELDLIDAHALLIVFRVSVPGAARAEALLARVGNPGVPLVAAAVGPRRWPRMIAAGAGPRLTELRRQGRVVPVPIDAALAITGLSPAPLATSIHTAGQTLLNALAIDTKHRTTAAADSCADGADELPQTLAVRAIR